MNAVLYIRVSTAEQASQNNSLPVQERKLRDYCQQHGIQVLKLFADKGESARTDDRPEFRKMLAYCRQHRKEISYFIVSDLSRLARNVLDQGQTVMELGQMGIKLISVDEPNLDESAAGKLLKNVLGSMNQFFSDSLSEKTKFRMKAGVEKGRWLWVAPLGYKNDINTKSVVIDSDVAPYVQKAFNLVLETSKSVDGILRLLTGMGFKTRRGNRVSEQTFARVLRNEFYAGWVVSGDLRVRGNHEPLISQDIFDRVQERLSGKSAVVHKRVNEDFPLKGFIRCVNCNKNLTAGWAKGRNGKKLAYYWCWNKACKDRVTAPKEDAEYRYFELLAMHVRTARLVAKLPSLAAQAWAARKETVAEDARILARRLNEQTTLKRKLIEAKLSGDIGQGDFQAMKTSIEDEIVKIEEERKALDSETSMMEDIIKKQDTEPLNFGHIWRAADFHHKIEMQKVFYPEGLVYSPERGYFETPNRRLFQQLEALFADELNIGVPDGI